MIVDAHQLATFEAFAEHLNFTRAGAALGLSQPAVHAQVQRLSEALGVILYQRQGRRLVLTPAGQATLAFARERARRQAEFVNGLQGAAVAQPARLAGGEGVLLYALGPALAAHVRAGHPTPRLQVAGADEVREAVQTGAVDIGVLPRAALRPDLEAVQMLRVGQALICPADHPLAQRARIRISDLHDLPLIAPPPGRPQRIAIEATFADAGAACRIAVEVTGWPLVLHLAGLGLGLAIVNDYCPAPAGCVQRPIDGLPGVTLFAVRRRGAPRTGVMDDLWRRMPV